MIKHKLAGNDSKTIEDRLAQLEAFLPMLARLDFAEAWSGKSLATRMTDLEELVSIESPDISRAIFFGSTHDGCVADWVPSSVPEQERPVGESLTSAGQILQGDYNARTMTRPTKRRHVA